MQKKELVKFREYDYEGIERHLEKMAAKGWMLSSAGPIFWAYEECEPKKLKFALSYRKDEKEMEQGEWGSRLTHGPIPGYSVQKKKMQGLYMRMERKDCRIYEDLLEIMKLA